MKAYLSHLANINKRKAYTTFGWHDDTFLLGHVLFTPNTEPQLLKYNVPSNCNGLGLSKGTLSSWEAETIALCSNPSWWLVVLTGLATPLLDLVEANQHIYFSVKQGHGMTTVLKMIYSLFGDPTTISIEQTPKEVQSRLQILKNLPVFVADVRASLSQKISGTDRSWNTLAITSISNATPCKNTFVFSLSSPTTHIYDPIKSFGVIGYKFLQYVVDNKCLITQELRASLSTADIGQRNTEAVRVCMHYAAHILESITNIIVPEARNLIDASCPAVCSTDIIDLFIERHKHAIVSVTDSGIDVPEKTVDVHNIVAKVDYRSAFRVASIDYTAWRKFVGTTGVDYRKAFLDLDRSNRVVQGRIDLDLLSGTQYPPVEKQCIVILLSS